MILLPKHRIPLLQQGGNIDRYMLNAGSQYTPAKLTQPGFAPYYTPDQISAPKRTRSGVGNRSSSKNKVDERLKAKGFSNDIEYAYGEYDKIWNSMAEKAQNADYLTSPEYKQDYMSLQKANVMISQLESIQKEYNTSLKGKNVEGGSYAIHNGQALVFDKAAGDYDIVELQQAMGQKDKEGNKQYRIETIATAQNLRGRDVNFNGFTEDGKFLQELVLNSYNSEDLYDKIDDAFKNSGITSDMGTNVALSDGSLVDADDLYRYLASGLDFKAQIMKNISSNKGTLQDAVTNMMSRVTSNPGTLSAYQKYAVGKMLDQGADPSSLSKGQFNHVVDQYIKEDLITRMKVFVEEKFGTKFKDETRKAGGGRSGSDPGKKKVHTNPIAWDQSTVSGFFQLEQNGYFEGDTTSLGIQKSRVNNGAKFFHDGFVGTTDTPAYRLMSKNLNLRSLIDGSISTAGGVLLDEFNDGQGEETAVIPDDSQLEVLHDVPVQVDPNTGAITISMDYLKMMDLFIKTRDNAIEQAGLTPETEGFSEKARKISSAVEAQLKEKVDGFSDFMTGIESGSIGFRNMATWDVIVPENFYNLAGEKTDLDRIGQDTEPANKEEYMSLSGDDAYDGMGFLDEVYRVKVFAPIITAAKQNTTQFLGVKDLTLTKDELKSLNEMDVAERAGYNNRRTLHELSL